MSFHFGGRGPGHLVRSPLTGFVGTTGVSASPLTLAVNMSTPTWFTYDPVFMDTAYSAPGNTAGERGGITGSTSGNTIPDANRDANGNANTLPGGEAALQLVCQLPTTLAQRKLTWSSKLGGTNHGCATITAGNVTGAVVDLVNRSATYTPTAIADGSAGSPPFFNYTPVSAADYPINFIDRPVVDSGAVLAPEFASLIPQACSPNPVIRFMDWTTVNRHNTPVWQGQSSQPATSPAGKTISSITFVGTLATVTTSTAHGLLGIGTGSASASVTVSGVTPATYNVADAYVKVISPTQFQYTMGGTPAGNATIMGSYAVGDFNFQYTNLHYPVTANEPGVQFNEPIYTSANRNKNKADAEWHDGVMLESIVSLCTALGASPYYQVPFNCDSTFLSDVATVLATFAQSTGKPVYHSLSNEVWNSGFKAFHQSRNEANLRGTLGDALPSCRLVTTTNVGLSGLAAIDGFTPIAGDRILVAGQSTASQNGPYIAAAGAWSRAADVVPFRSIWLVTDGLTSAQTSWFVSTQGAITLGTTPLAIAQISLQHRYAEKLITAANAFRTAFASAGVSSLLNVVAEWQNYANTTIWDDMAAFVGAADWAKVTHISVAPYYGDNSSTALVSAGIGTGYVGSTATLKAAVSADIDDTLTHHVGHVNKAVALGKKLINYEGGQTLTQTDQTYKTTWVRSADSYDLELRYLQQMELRAASLQAGGLIHLQYNIAFPLGGSNYSWGLIESLTQTRGKATTPKLQAHIDFLAGTRVLTAATGTLSDTPSTTTVGTSMGFLSGSAYGVTWSLTNNDGGRVAINATTGECTVAAGMAGTANGARSITARQTVGAQTFDTVVAYNVASAFLDNFNDNSRDTTLWPTVGGFSQGNSSSIGAALEQNNRLECKPAISGANAIGYVSAARDVTGKTYYIKVVIPADMFGHDEDAYFHVGESAIKYMGFRIGGSKLIVYRYNGSAGDFTFATYDAAAQGWLKIAHTPTGWDFAFAPASVNPPANGDWTDMGTVPFASDGGIDATICKIAFGAYTPDGDVSGTAVYFDGFNTAT